MATTMAAACTVVGVLLDFGPTFKEGQNVLDFGLHERVNRWMEATSICVRKQSMRTIHAAEGATGTHAGIGAGNYAAETFLCMGTGRGTRISARAGACAGRCMGTGTGARISARVGECAGRCTGA